MALDDLIGLMERFVSGEAISVADARKLEGLLREATPEHPELEDLADDLAQYQLGGGDYLYDFERMKPRVAHDLDVLRARGPDGGPRMRGLDHREMQLIGNCLRAAADGPFFEDWEFATLFGVERAEVRRVAGEWPRVDANDEIVSCAVQNALNNLLGYPHDMDAELRASVPDSAGIEEVLAKWRKAG